MTPKKMPSTSDTLTTRKPTSSDRRAPCIRRDRMSRPTSSVPSTNRQEPPSSQAGGCSKASRYCMDGSCGAISPAKIATSSMTTMVHRPISAPRLRLKSCQKDLNGPGGAETETVALEVVPMSVSSPAMADARIGQPIQDIDAHIDDDDEGGDHQHAALDDRIVALLQAIDQPAPDARPGKDGFGQDRPRPQHADLQADHREHRQQRVAQGMDHDHPQARQTL